MLKGLRSVLAVGSNSSFIPSRAFSHSRASAAKVAVIGAAGGIGQPLSLLLKLDKNVTELSLYDVAPFTPGVATDISHMPYPAKVKGYTGDDLHKALEACDIVVVPAGVPRKPGMTRDDLFNTNAGIVKNIATAVAKACPNANLLIISNPVNSTVPIAAECLKQAGVYNPKRLFGVTTLDVIRANTFVSEQLGKPAADINVPVVGGHAGITIIPLLSQISQFPTDVRDALTKRIMFGGDEVVQAKGGAGSATLSMAYAGYRFTNALLRALKGEKVKEFSFVQSEVVPGVPFFSSQVTLGKNGVEKIEGVEHLLNAYEKELLKAAIPELQASIAKGVAFANK